MSTILDVTDTPHCWDDLVSPETRTVYADYLGERRLGTAPALLLIDVYNRAFGDRPEPLMEARQRFPGSCGLAAWETLPHMYAVLEAARRLGAPVIYTTAEHRREARLGWETHRVVREATDPAWGAAIVDAVKPTDGEIVLSKVRASAFFGTPLITYLTQRRVDTLVVMGLTTSGCVRASVVDAYSYGLHVAVVEEATVDRIPMIHQSNLFDMHHKYATVIHNDLAIE